MKYIPIVNKIYNNYTVISKEIVKNNSGTSFHVQCTCGKIEFKAARHLESGRSKMCKSCSAKQTFKNYTPKSFISSWDGKGKGLISKTWFNSIKHGANRRNIRFELTIEEIWDLANKQNFKCALTGLPIFFSKSIKDSNVNWDIITASLDRIDSDEPYCISNVQWVHKEFNRFKNNYKQEDFIKMCRQVVDFQIEKTILSQVKS